MVKDSAAQSNPIKEYEERILNDVALRRQKNSKRQIYTVQEDAQM
jgi:hypothetical protein